MTSDDHQFARAAVGSSRRLRVRPVPVGGGVTFEDHFSGGAHRYAVHRPTYPPALFAHLAALAPARRLAWDCATGNGQAALGLAPRFVRVAATDASEAQIAHAMPHPRVEYRAAPAEASGLTDGFTDLVVVAQALHWLPLDAFYAEVRRVIAPSGVIAVWAYGDAFTGSSAIDSVFSRLTREIVGPYWPPERQFVDDGYRTLPFPFREVASPPFRLTQDWTLEELTGYFRTWSASTRYRSARGVDPVGLVEPELRDLWGDRGDRRTIEWPLAVRIGYVER